MPLERLRVSSQACYPRNRIRQRIRRRKWKLGVLAAARTAGLPIPCGEVADEEPDFRFGTDADSLGIELTELLRPPSSNNGISPVAEESYHREVMSLAEAEYSGPPVHVSVYFEDSRGVKRDKNIMARSLSHFVQSKVADANPYTVFMDGTPAGFSSIKIELGYREWWSGEAGGYTIADIRQQLTSRISEKNKLLPRYRANLPLGAPVWLLLYSLPSVARGMEFPYDIENWSFSFDFDRVFWFVSYLNDFVQLRNSE